MSAAATVTKTAKKVSHNRINLQGLVSQLRENYPYVEDEYAGRKYLSLTEACAYLGVSMKGRLSLYRIIRNNADVLVPLCGIRYIPPSNEVCELSREVHVSSGYVPGTVYGISLSALAFLLCIFNNRFARKVGWANITNYSYEKNAERLIKRLQQQ